jgi:4'-phosphopantetheinyl transferase
MRTKQGSNVSAIAAELSEDQIHIWRLGYDRAQRRAPLLALLALYLGIPADAIVLVDGEHGRPALAEPFMGTLEFNWSHSGDRALIALARGCAPGIDIEQVRPRPRAMQLAERFFHPEETAALSALDKSEQERGFLQLWTAKEAVLKAMGRGIAFGLERLQLAAPPAAPHVLWLDGDDARQWQLQSVAAGEGYVASVAWRGPARDIRCWTLADSA